jgi:hypothetical protein
MASLHDPLPTLRPAPRETRRTAGADVIRYIFIVEDFHLLLLVGLPTHYQPPLLLTYPTQRSNHVMTGPDPVIVIGWLLIGIAPFAIGCG